MGGEKEKIVGVGERRGCTEGRIILGWGLGEGRVVGGGGVE